MPDKHDEAPKPELDDFIQQLTAAQTNLRAYILASVGNAEDAAEVLQRTNLSLWKNATKFQADAPFMPWAVTIAKYEVLSYCRDKSRDRHVYPEDLANLMLETASEIILDMPDRQEALRHCLGRLSGKQHEMLKLRYYEEKPISQIASALERTENSVKSAFVRIRKSLLKCIEARLKST